MRLGHMPQRADVNLAQQVDVPWLDLLPPKAAPIRKQIPPCLLHIVKHHVLNWVSWGKGCTSSDCQAIWATREDCGTATPHAAVVLPHCEVNCSWLWLLCAQGHNWIRQLGGGHAVTRLICHYHGLPHWRHLCLHSWDDGANDDGRGDEWGHHINICGREEVGHHEPINIDQQKQKQNQNQKQKQK